ncbi:hypothetical protein J7E55_25915 [Bacillus sp. ISL-53]|nr:hypothetical protein [Bacillus sp. ISL-53]
MQKQFKLFKYVKTTPPTKDAVYFNNSELIGVEYSPNSRNLLTITDSMTSKGFKQFFFTPRFLRNILLNSKKSEKIRINEIEFIIEPEFEVGTLLDAFYNKEDSIRSKRLSKSLLEFLSENEAIKMSFYVKGTYPVTKINIYQSGLVHINNAPNNLDWFVDYLKEVKP